MEGLNLNGKRIRIFLKGTGFKYSGKVLAESDEFITLHDELDDAEKIFSKESISVVEVL